MSFVYLTIIQNKDEKRHVVFTTIAKACSYVEKQFMKYIEDVKDETIIPSEYVHKFQPINVIKLFSVNSHWTLSEVVHFKDFACYMQRLHMDSID